MGDEVTPDIESLEKRLQSEPESLSLRDRLLWRYSSEEALQGHQRRIGHLLWFVQNFPRDSVCRTPVFLVDPKVSPEGYQAIENEWLRLLAENPGDADVARGAANFVCMNDLDQAKKILGNIIDNDPNQADVWLDLGRYTAEAKDQLRIFQEARRRGSKQPNLLVWISRAAVEAGDFDTAEAVGKELLTLVDEARDEYGDKLDWKEKGRAIWQKALEFTGDKTAASELVRAISAHAYHKHWGHIALGHVALHRNDLISAVRHLRESGSVVSDPRLSSYGPSFTLAKELCIRGEWTDVAEYIEACRSFWDDERLPIWKSLVESQKLPDFNLGAEKKGDATL